MAISEDKVITVVVVIVTVVALIIAMVIIIFIMRKRYKLVQGNPEANLTIQDRGRGITSMLSNKRMNKVKQSSAVNITTLLRDHKHIDKKSVCHRRKVKTNIILPISSPKHSSKKLQVIINTKSTQDGNCDSLDEKKMSLNSQRDNSNSSSPAACSDDTSLLVNRSLRSSAVSFQKKDDSNDATEDLVLVRQKSMLNVSSDALPGAVDSHLASPYSGQREKPFVGRMPKSSSDLGTKYYVENKLSTRDRDVLSTAVIQESVVSAL
jgi:hypothetical protein